MPLENVFGSLALDATLLNRFGGGKIPVATSVATVGNNTVYTPAAGKSVRLFWVQAIASPDGASAPLITIRLGTQNIYVGYALSHWEIFTGAVDAPLVVNLSASVTVAISAHVTEV